MGAPQTLSSSGHCRATAKARRQAPLSQRHVNPALVLGMKIAPERLRTLSADPAPRFTTIVREVESAGLISSAGIAGAQQNPVAVPWVHREVFDVTQRLRNVDSLPVLSSISRSIQSHTVTHQRRAGGRTLRADVGKQSAVSVQDDTINPHVIRMAKLLVFAIQVRPLSIDLKTPASNIPA